MKTQTKKNSIYSAVWRMCEMRALFVGSVICAMTSGTVKAEETADVLEWNAESQRVLLQKQTAPDTVFANAKLVDYEPAYAHLSQGSSSGNRYFVSAELAGQILRAYNVVRSEENGKQTMTVQFQGVTRTSVTMPYTASVSVKFIQEGSDIVAYQTGAASLKPLDVELGLNIDAMLAASDPRVESRPFINNGEGSRNRFNITTIVMRKPVEPISYAVKNGGSVNGSIAGNGVVTVSNAVVDTVTRSGYLPSDSWVVVAENRNLADLDEVTGIYRCETHFVEQKAFNFMYSGIESLFGNKSCQFQIETAKNFIRCLPVRFRQNGSNVEAKTSRWWMYYITASGGGVDQIKLGMDFEKYDDGTVPKRMIYGNNVLAVSDNDEGKMGVKNLTLKFHSRPAVAIDEYMPNTFDDGIDRWNVIAPNHSLSDLVEMEAFYHNTVNKGYYVPGLHLNISGTSGTVQFQDKPTDILACITVGLRQKGNNIEARTGRYYNNFFKSISTYPELVYGFDFVNYKQYTQATKETYGKGSFAASDSDAKRGIKYLRMRFATEGIAYSAASMSRGGNELVFRGNESSPLSVRTVSSTVFPSNGVVTVNPFATLTLSDHVANHKWTKYRVMTNGVLKLKGILQTASTDQIDLIGGTLSIREDETDAKQSDSYLNYVTLMNGACVKGKLAKVLNDSPKANWIVSGDSPSSCESGIMLMGAGNGGSRTFNFNVNDVAEGSDFIVSGRIVDFDTISTDTTGYWNVHVVKNGEGAMEVSGDITLPNEFCVSNGMLRLAKDNLFKVSRKRQETGENSTAAVWLAGGGLEAAAGTENIVAVVAKAAASPLVLEDGATVTLSSFSCDAGASLLVSDNIGKTATLRIENATSAQLSSIRCGEDRLRVRLNSAGDLEPYFNAFHISIR